MSIETHRVHEVIHNDAENYIGDPLWVMAPTRRARWMCDMRVYVKELEDRVKEFERTKQMAKALKNALVNAVRSIGDQECPHIEEYEEVIKGAARAGI